MSKFVKIIIGLSFIIASKVNAQISVTGCTLNGGMSNGKTVGCGNTPNPCNLASVYSNFGTFCGSTVVSGSGGHVTATSNLILPAGCNATITVEMRTRTNIHASGCNNGGMDANDAISITNSGGIISSQGATLCCSTSSCGAYPTLNITPVTFANSNIPTGCSNANGIAQMVVSGGTVTISGTSDRADEITTFTITLDETTCGPNCNQVLPIDLSDFYAYRLNNSIAIKWEVKMELNLKNYLLERSHNAVDFTSIAEILPQMPPHSQTFTYHYSDDNPLQGINYYRLTNIDSDGSKQQHPIIAINFNAIQSNLWHSESVSDITIGLSRMNDNAEFVLMDMAGKIIRRINFLEGTYSIMKTEIAAGLYYIKDLSGQIAPYKIMVFN